MTAVAMKLEVDSDRAEAGNADRRSLGTIVLRVSDPEAVAARYWDVGCTVLVGGDEGTPSPAVISVLDPFGLRIDLVGS
jgi:hypothetical protein